MGVARQWSPKGGATDMANKQRERDYNKNPANDNGTDDGDGDGRPDRDLNAGGPETANTHNTRANDSHGLGEAQAHPEAEAATAVASRENRSELGNRDADNVSGDMAIGHPHGDDPTDPPAGAKGVLPGRESEAQESPDDAKSETDVVDNPPTAPIDVGRSRR